MGEWKVPAVKNEKKRNKKEFKFNFNHNSNNKFTGVGDGVGNGVGNGVGFGIAPGVGCGVSATYTKKKIHFKFNFSKQNNNIDFIIIKIYKTKIINYFYTQTIDAYRRSFSQIFLNDLVETFAIKRASIADNNSSDANRAETWHAGRCPYKLLRTNFVGISMRQTKQREENKIFK